ncbi:hypothetical protein N0B51_10300 [Tsuneonella sp. YG55]|uniref:Uncharacterized protein n=1 Tax=Tsuneonella litorea TaxID=2976475 RepID=A0A9X3AL76_9SPHN|nr:hypothetical protein [Tsuneonella litorea]MCT2559369.1 hypothetical protein [Tsuneonella litorea]
MKHLTETTDNPPAEHRGRPLRSFKDDPLRGAAAVGSRSPAFGMTMLRQAHAALAQVPGTSADQRWAQFDALFDFLESVAPRDEREGMLAVQMFATHNAVMDCYRRAATPGQTCDMLDLHYKYAVKLGTLSLQQHAALDRHRGGGQQKITVEHVTVEAGGQAIVGDVSLAKGNGGPGGDGQRGDAGAGASERSPAQQVRVRQRTRNRR